MIASAGPRRIFGYPLPSWPAADPSVLLGLALVAVLLLQAWGNVRSQPQEDFWEIWSIGRLSGTHADIYSADARASLAAELQVELRAPWTSPREIQAASYWKSLEPVGTPALFALFGFLQTGDFELDSGVFAALGLVALLLATAWMCRRVGIGATGTLLAIAILLVASYPLWLDLYVGNLNALQVGIVVLYLAVRARPVSARTAVLAGMLLGAAIVVKPNLVLVAGLLGAELAIRRRWRDLAGQGSGLAFGGVIAVTIATLRFGSLEPWAGWAGSFSDIVYAAGHPVAWGNSALPRFVREAVGADVVPLLLGLLTGAALLILWRSRPARFRATPTADAGEARTGTATAPPRASSPDARGPDAGALETGDPDALRWGRETLVSGAAIAITLLAAPTVWQHYSLLLVPVVIYLVRPAGRRFGGSAHVRLRQGTAVVAVVLLSQVPVSVSGLQPGTTWYLLAAVAATGLVLAAALVELAAADPVSAAAAG